MASPMGMGYVGTGQQARVAMVFGDLADPDIGCRVCAGKPETVGAAHGARVPSPSTRRRADGAVWAGEDRRAVHVARSRVLRRVLITRELRHPALVLHGDDVLGMADELLVAEMRGVAAAIPYPL